MRRFHRKRRKGLSPAVVMLPLAALAAALLWNGGPPGFAFELPGVSPGATDREAARFVACAGSARTDCVVDGDTFWYHGRKIRIADINTPETSEPDCRREAELGEAAATRLTELLNAGPFTLAAGDRENDSYGRALRIVTRGGASLGSILTREGLAEPWRGRRGDWC